MTPERSGLAVHDLPPFSNLLGIIERLFVTIMEKKAQFGCTGAQCKKSFLTLERLANCIDLVFGSFLDLGCVVCLK
jgi:hypothetical protein